MRKKGKRKWIRKEKEVKDRPFSLMPSVLSSNIFSSSQLQIRKKKRKKGKGKRIRNEKRGERSTVFCPFSTVKVLSSNIFSSSSQLQSNK